MAVVYGRGILHDTSHVDIGKEISCLPKHKRNAKWLWCLQARRWGDPLGNGYESSAFIRYLPKSHYDGWFSVTAHQFVKIKTLMETPSIMQD